MKVLVVAYKIAAGEGSESGSGYNFVSELSQRIEELTVVTRRDQAEALAKDPQLPAVRFVGIDVPRWQAFWKKGSRGVIPYYYLWQWHVSRLVARLHREQSFDVVHQYNFHTDWAPHFLRTPGARVIWGPVCHQPLVPGGYLILEPVRGRLRELAKVISKRLFWHLDPCLRRAISRTDVILYANSDVAPPFRRSPAVHRQTFGGSTLQVPASQRSPGPLRLIHVGRQVAIKGPSVALQTLSRTTEDVRLELIGSGPLHERLRRQADRLGILERVTFTPWLSRDELAERYAESDALLYPTLANQDTVVAEALHAGLPVIGVRCAGTESMVGDSDLIVPWSRRHSVLLERLAAAVDDTAAAKTRGDLSTLSDRASDRARLLSWPATTEGILAWYR